MNRKKGNGSLGAQILDDFPGKMLIDFTVPRDGFRNIRGGVTIPVVAASMAYELTSCGFNFADEIEPFHAISNSNSAL
jgi:hypothetical protein